MLHYNQTARRASSINEENHGNKHRQRSPTSKKRYVLEEYPPRMRKAPDFNPLYDAFRPITPPPHFNQRESVYDKPCGHYLDNGQQQQQARNLSSANRITCFQKNTESSPTSEIEFMMEKLGGDKHLDLEKGAQPKRTRRRHLLNNLFDFIAIAITCLIFGLIYLLIKPVQRGFFCDDTSIQYPYKHDTIPMWLLGVYGGIGPIVIFCIVEIWVVRPFQCGRGPARYSLKQRRVDYFKTIIQTIFLFALGITICFLITEVGKRTIGRLRPYYVSICNPHWANITCEKNVTTANGFILVPQYIIEHNCNTNASATDLQEAKLSFPSGHSSYSTYAFVFLFVYFEARLVCPNIQFLKPLLQCICIAIAFFTCLSRVTDFKHHPTDVIGGAIIGFCIAVFAAVRVGTYLWSFGVYCETEEETEKDRLPKEERVPIPGIETKKSGALRSNEQIQLDTFQPVSTRSRNSNRSSYDNNLPNPNQYKHGLQPVLHGTRRIAPGKAFDEQNA